MICYNWSRTLSCAFLWLYLYFSHQHHWCNANGLCSLEHLHGLVLNQAQWQPNKLNAEDVKNLNFQLYVLFCHQKEVHVEGAANLEYKNFTHYSTSLLKSGVKKEL